jgi:hypothetical protein
LTGLLDHCIAKADDVGYLVSEYVESVERSPTALLPLAVLRIADISDDGILSLLAAIEFTAFRAGCELAPRALPIFIQRFAGKFPILSQYMRECLSARPAVGSVSTKGFSSGADQLQELRETAYRTVRPRSYRGVKCIEQGD